MNNIIKGLIFSLLFFGPFLSNGSVSNNFEIISTEDYLKRKDQEKDVFYKKRYIVANLIKKKDLTNVNSVDSLFSIAMYLIDKGSFSKKIHAQLKEKDKQIVHLITAYYYLCAGNYNQALIQSAKYEQGAYLFYKNILYADCRYEILTQKHDINQVFPFYQKAFDYAPDELQKKIVIARTHYIRYVL